MAAKVHKILHHRDVLKCNHGGVVDLDPTKERHTEIESDLRVVTKTDLLASKIKGCSNTPKCTTIVAVPVGLAKDVELTGGTIPVLGNLKADTDVPGGFVTWPGPALDIDKAVKHLDDNAKTHKPYGDCDAYVERAIRAGGVNVDHSPGAKDLPANLLKHGFRSVPTGADSATYAPQKGDVVVFGPRGADARGHVHEWGHTAMYDGKQWVSDFKQPGLYVNDVYKQGSHTFYRTIGGFQAYAAPK